MKIEPFPCRSARHCSQPPMNPNSSSALKAQTTIHHVPGDVELPAIQLPWWDIAAGEWKMATLPARTISILPSADAPPPQITAPIEVADAGEAAGAVVIHSNFWRMVSEVLAGVWILTILAWWWSGKPKAKQREREEPPIYKQQSRLIKQARKGA